MTSSLSRHKGSNNHADFQADSDINFTNLHCPLFILLLSLLRTHRDTLSFSDDWLYDQYGGAVKLRPLFYY